MPHSPEVAEALEKSIQHWRENAAVDNLFQIRVGASFCALCSIFNRSTRSDRCVGCPVNERTGSGCFGNKGYQKAVDAKHLSDTCAFRAAAHEEVAFLESLRDPEPHAPEKSGS